MDKKAMKKTWTVFGQKIKVKLVDELYHPDNGAPLYGLFDPDKNMIYVRNDLTAKQKEATLAHELGHALMFRLGIAQTTLSLDLHEIIVEGFGNFIAENYKPK